MKKGNKVISKSLVELNKKFGLDIVGVKKNSLSTITDIISEKDLEIVFVDGQPYSNEEFKEEFAIVA